VNAHTTTQGTHEADDDDALRRAISEELIALPTADIDYGILQLLSRGWLPSCIDRVLVMQELDEPGVLVATHVWDSPMTDVNTMPRDRVFPIETYSWRRSAVSGQEVVIDGTTDRGALSANERTYLETWRFTNLIALPLHLVHVEHAMMLTVSLRGPARTPPQTVDTLRWCARIIAHLLTRKHTEERARHDAVAARHGFDQVESGMWEWDLRTDAIWLSEQWCRMVGELPGSMENNAEVVRRHIHADDMSMVWETLARHVADPTVEYRLRYRVLHLDGSVRWILSRGFATERDADGRATRMTGVDTDITDILKEESELRSSRDALATALRELEAAWRFKQEFITNIGHEFRTPLTTTLGVVDLMKMSAKDPLTDWQRMQVARIEERSRELLALIEDLIDVSAFEERSDTLVRERVEFADICRSALKLAGRRAARKRMKVDADMPTAAVPLMGDPVRLRQMVLNLLLHSVVTGAERSTLSLRLFVDARSSEACLELRATASGILPVETLHARRSLSLADALGMMHASAETLPLSLVLHIVTLHGGDAQLDVGPDTGTRITLRLPLAGAG
jgi:signal transduction histidine kinase